MLTAVVFRSLQSLESQFQPVFKEFINVNAGILLRIPLMVDASQSRSECAGLQTITIGKIHFSTNEFLAGILSSHRLSSDLFYADAEGPRTL